MRLKCLYPFTFLEFQPRGKVFCCCPAWTKFGPVGNVYRQSIEEIWNGRKIIKLRKKIYEGKYNQVCNLNYCPFIKNPINLSALKKTRNKKLLKIIRQVEQKKLYLETGPSEISLAHSGECNLRCKMCISHAGINPPEPRLNKLIFKKVIPPLLKDLSLIKLTGNGDPFVQKETIEFLQNFNQKKFPQIRFEILTNGLLLNKKMWDSIKHNKFKSINISIDAASKNTYEKIRIGGRWEILQKNLQLLSKLRKQKRIGKFYINMTVMRSNFKEIKDFALMGKNLGCDGIYFAKIFGLKDLKDIKENVNFFADPKILKEIKQTLKQAIFKQPQIHIEGINEYLRYKPVKCASIKFNIKLFLFGIICNQTTRRLRKRLRRFKKSVKDTLKS